PSARAPRPQDTPSRSSRPATARKSARDILSTPDRFCLIADVNSIRRIAAAAAIASSFVSGAIVRTAQQSTPGSPDGRAVYERECAHCHNGSEPRAPSPDALRGRSPQAIVDALTSGSMRYQGLTLSGAERRTVAEFLAGRALRGSVAGAAMGRCATPAPLGNPLRGAVWNGWSPTAENAHFQPAAAAGLSAEQVPRLRLKWAFGFPDTTSAWAQPTIAGRRVFVGGQNGTVYALDARSGCIIWTFTAHTGVRTAVS